MAGERLAAQGIALALCSALSLLFPGSCEGFISKTCKWSSPNNNSLLSKTRSKLETEIVRKIHSNNTAKVKYPYVIDQLGRTWVCDKELRQKAGLQRDRMMWVPKRTSDGGLIPWRAFLGRGQSMLRRKPGKGQVPHFEEDDERWMHRYERLVSFKAQFGHTEVPLKYDEDPSLGQWCNKQRHQYSLFNNANRSQFDEDGNRVAFISQWRIDKLQELGFDFSHYLKWHDRFQQLQAFYDRHGHSNVPKNYSKDPSLYYWIKHQRGAIDDPQKKQLLDSLDFDWDPRNTQWNRNFQRLKLFYQKHNHTNISEITADSHSLAKWVIRQRDTLRHCINDQNLINHTNINSDIQQRILKLQSINFDFHPTNSTWNHHFHQLQHFQSQHGHCNVPINYTPNPSLAAWVSRQRKYYKSTDNHTILTPHRIHRLNGLNFTWDVSQNSWERNYHKLQLFHKKHGNCDVPFHYAPDPSLPKWVNHQRHQYKLFQQNKTNSLSSERIQLLHQIDFQWNIFTKDWTQNFEKLKSFRQSYNHCNVPKKHDPSLYNWIQSQRRSKRLSTLHPDRIQKLNSIQFVWDPKQELWNRRYSELRDFFLEKGHCRVPISHGKLGKWVGNQRTQYKKKLEGVRNTMTEERIGLLNDIGFEWTLR